MLGGHGHAGFGCRRKKRRASTRKKKRMKRKWSWCHRCCSSPSLCPSMHSYTISLAINAPAYRAHPRFGLPAALADLRASPWRSASSASAKRRRRAYGGWNRRKRAARRRTQLWPRKSAAIWKPRTPVHWAPAFASGSAHRVSNNAASNSLRGRRLLCRWHTD